MIEPADVHKLRAQIEAIDAVIASGTTRVTTDDGSTVEYRDLDELRSVRESLMAQLDLATGTLEPPRVTRQVRLGTTKGL